MFRIDATYLGRAMNCNGSRLLDRPQLSDDTDTLVRDEGNAFHWLSQEIFEGRLQVDNAVGLQAYNGVFITAAMVKHAQEYINALWAGEMEVTTSWGGIYFQIDGRADHIGYNPDTAELFIDDAKYGYSLVEPEHNWTLISHAIGYTKAKNIQPSKITLTIHQPRSYHPLGTTRLWSFGYYELCRFAEQIDHTLSNPTDQLCTGSHCYKCPSMTVCPAYRMASMNAIDATSHAFNDNLSAEELVEELELLEYASNVIISRKKAIDELALFRAANGEILPGRMIDRPKGQTRYKKNITPDMLSALIGRDLSEKKLPKVSALRDNGVAEMIIDAITERPEGSARLIKVDINKLAAKKLNLGAK
jgi:hypothetical protein